MSEEDGGMMREGERARIRRQAGGTREEGVGRRREAQRARRE